MHSEFISFLEIFQFLIKIIHNAPININDTEYFLCPLVLNDLRVLDVGFSFVSFLMQANLSSSSFQHQCYWQQILNIMMQFTTSGSKSLKITFNIFSLFNRSISNFLSFKPSVLVGSVFQDNSSFYRSFACVTFISNISVSCWVF